jgi:YVTN family beta-propeller protein
MAAVATSHAQYVEDSIDVGGTWVGSLAYSSELDEVWGSSWGGNSVFAVGCDSNKVVAALALRRAGDLAYDSVNGKLYCAYYGPGEESLAVIIGGTHQIIKKVEMPGSTTPVWDAVSSRVYVSCQSTNSVAVVDCSTDSLLMYIPVGACPLKMYINKLRRKLYVLNYDDGTVSIVNMATNQVIKTVDVGGAPNAGYYCQSVDKFYSGGEFRQCIVISGQSDTIVARITLPGNVDVMGATGNEDDGLVYVGASSGTNDYVATVSSQNDSVIATTVIGQEPWGLAYYGPSGLLYCTSSITDEVCILTGDGRQTLATLQVGNDPFVFAQVPRHNRLYLGHLGCRYVYVLRDTSAGIAEPQLPGLAFQGVSVTPNPFSQRVALAWNVPARGNDVACIHAPDGSLVRQAQIAAGASRWVWDGCDNRGRPASPGVYVLTAPGGVRAKAVKLK